MKPEKILIIRFSSIGDIVLTTSVVRSLKKCFPSGEIHYLTKKQFAPLIQHHPSIHKVHEYDGDLSKVLAGLKKENFTLVLDLHSSLRSRALRLRLGVPSIAYKKEGLNARIYAKFRIGKLPSTHVVERYEAALRKAGCTPDGGGLDFYIPDEVLGTANARVKEALGDKALCVALGARYQTKKWIPEYFITALNLLGKPVLLIGGPEEKAEAEQIAKSLHVPVLNATGTAGLLESAAMMRACEVVITHDSGFMHIASALGKKIVSLWGHSIPAFGFSPWKADAVILEVQGLSCRPCSKLGYDQCPRGHFKCMRDISPRQVVEAVQQKWG